MERLSIMSFKEIKKKAKGAYKGNVSGCVGAGLASFVIKSTPALVIFTIQFMCIQNMGDNYNGIFSGIFGLLYLAAAVFVYLPVCVGEGMYFTAKVCGKRPVIDKIFCAYKKLNVRGAAAAVPFGIIILESTIFNVLSFAAYKLLGGNGIFGAAAVMLIELIVIIYTLMAYAPLTYVLETYGDISAGMAIGKTLRISSKKRGKIFGFYLSFILWFLLGILTLGIGFVWIAPYMRLSAAELFKDLDKN